MNDDLLKKYELTPSKDNVRIQYDRQLWQARYSPCGNFLLACGYDATIQRWDLRSEKPTLMKALLGHDGWVQCMDFVQDQKQLITADSWGKLVCWSYEETEPKVIWQIEQAHEGWIRAIAISPDGATIATGGNGESVSLWSSKDGKKLKELPHTDRVYSLRFHPHENQTLVSGDLKGVIRIWNTNETKEIRRLDAALLYNDEAISKGRIQQCGGVRVLEFHPDGNQLVCGGQKDSSGGFATGTPCAIIYDWESGKIVREMPIGSNQDGFTYDAQFHPDGFVMATSSAFPGKGHVWFWLPSHEKAFFVSKKLPNGRSLSLHPDGKSIAHLVSNSRNANGRPLKDGEYEGGSAEIQILLFPPVADETKKN